MELTISKRFKSLLPALSDEESAQLEANIMAAGKVREPITVWQENGKTIIVDGMNRYAIAHRLGLPFETTELEFASRDDAELWILENQLGRRNLLKPHEIRKLRGELYNRLKRKDAGHGDQKSGGKFFPPIANAAEEVAAKTGVTSRTVKNDGALVEAVDSLVSPLRNLIEQGKATVTNAEAKQLAKQETTVQHEVARAVRTGSTLRDAMAQAGIKSVARAGDGGGKGSRGAAAGSGAGGDKENRKEDTASCLNGGKHSWASDGNGDRYCETCKEDHPGNKPKASAAKYLGGIAATVAKCRVNIDDVVREYGKHKLTDKIMADLDEAYKALKKWEASAK